MWDQQTSGNGRCSRNHLQNLMLMIVLLYVWCSCYHYHIPDQREVLTGVGGEDLLLILIQLKSKKSREWLLFINTLTHVSSCDGSAPPLTHHTTYYYTRQSLVVVVVSLVVVDETPCSIHHQSCMITSSTAVPSPSMINILIMMIDQHGLLYCLYQSSLLPLQKVPSSGCIIFSVLVVLCCCLSIEQQQREREPQRIHGTTA